MLHTVGAWCIAQPCRLTCFEAGNLLSLHNSEKMVAIDVGICTPVCQISLRLFWRKSCFDSESCCVPVYFSCLFCFCFVALRLCSCSRLAHPRSSHPENFNFVESLHCRKFLRSGCERDQRLLHPRIHWEFQDCLQDNNYCRKRDSELTIDRDERKKKGARIDIEDVKKILKETNSMIAVVEQASGKGRGAAHQSTQPTRPLKTKKINSRARKYFCDSGGGP